MNNYYDYYAVVESAVPTDIARNSFEVIKPHENKSTFNLDFLRFKACIMTVGTRNRNKRLWQQEHLDVMMNAPHILEFFQKGGLPGENGHPIPPTAPVTPDRLVTIDPNNLAFIVKEWWWEGPKMMAICETLDQGEGTPGNRMAKNAMQGMIPAFSARTMVPQRRNPDGTIDVIAPGRMVCMDRVIGPSCEGAYVDVSVPMKNIIKKAEFTTVMESFTEYISEHSDAVKAVMESMLPAMESASVASSGVFTAHVNNGDGTHNHIFIPVERNLRKEIAGFMTGL